MFCKRCGKEIPDSSNVCQHCGSQVTPRITENTYTNFNKITASQVPPAPQKKQKKTPWKIIAPIVAVLLVVAIVFGIFACTNSKKKEVEDKLRQILKESTTKPIVEFFCEDYDGDGTYEAIAVVGNSAEKAEYVEYYEANFCYVNEEGAEVIKESVRGHANGTIEVGNTIYVSLEVYDDGVETGKSFIYTSENNESVESDISGQYANVHEEDGKILATDEEGNEIEVELTDRNEKNSDDKEESKQVAKPKYQTVATSLDSTFAIKDDGTVLSTINREFSESYEGRGNVGSWTDIVSIVCGFFTTVGLKSDGTVVATKVLPMYDLEGNASDRECGQADVQGWTDIVAISAGMWHTVGLKSDGTVISTKITKKTLEYVEGELDQGQTDVEQWTDITAVYTTPFGTIGLKADKTVVAVGDVKGVNGWTDIVDINVYGRYQSFVVVGIKSNGTVVAFTNDEYGDFNVQAWTDIVDVAINERRIAGLKSDGTVVITSNSKEEFWRNESTKVNTWNNIKDIVANGNHIIGLKNDGTVVTTQTGGDEYSCNGAVGWTNIVAVYGGPEHYVGLKADGTMVGTQCRNMEDGDYGQGKVNDWTNIRLPE